MHKRNYKTEEFRRNAGVEVEALEQLVVRLLVIAHRYSEAPCRWRLDLMRLTDELANLIEQRRNRFEASGNPRSR